MIVLPPAALAAIEDGRITVRLALRADLDDGPHGIWNDVWDMVFGGCTFAAAGGNLTFDGISGSSTMSADKVTVSVSGLNQTINDIVSNRVWHQRPATIFIVWLDDSGQIMHVLPRFSGFLDAVAIADKAGGLATMALSIESNNRELSRQGTRTRSNADQRQVGGASDGFYAHVAAVAVNQNIYWGRAGPHSPN